VRFGLYLPPFGEFADARRVADLAVAAEETGWAGLFLWDHMLADPGLAVAEAWTTLAAMAMVTRAIRIGALVTPLARRRPWTLARQIATIDQLSGGRLVAGIGLGDDGWKEFSSFGETAEPRARGQLLDESLEILQGLLSGQPVRYQGDRYAVDSGPFLPRPAQDPVPIWAACSWPNRKPLARAARLQGCFPVFMTDGQRPAPPAAENLIALRAELRRLGAPDDHDLIVRCALHRLDPAQRPGVLATLADCGVTWLLEGFGPGQSATAVEAFVQAGPPTMPPEDQTAPPEDQYMGDR
jgi:alkanesulfonate monooxygenase SsuD/methylene tetrahydromethanopterin reductase-like flavin-dependent oxidoreductase (luciferase family)